MDMQQHYRDLIKHAEEKGWGVNEHTRKMAENYEPLVITTVDDDGKTVKEGTFEELFERDIPWWKDKIYYPLWRFWDRHISWIINPSAYRRWWQRRTRGWDDSDIWSMDYTFAKMILPRLKRYKEIDKQGVPSKVTFRYPHDGNYRMTDEDMKKAIQEWGEILDKMIWSFDFYLDDMNDAADEATWDRWREGMDLFVEYYSCLWW